MHREVEFNRGKFEKIRHSQGIIIEGDGTPVKITGYAISIRKTVITFVGYLLTAGLLRLVFHWFPHWMLKCTHDQSRLCDAQKVLVKDSSGTLFTHNIIRSNIALRQNPSSCDSCNGLQEATKNEIVDSCAYFVHKEMRYIWFPCSEQFELLRSWEEKPYSELFPAKPLPEEVVEHRRALYGTNEIVIRLTPILNMLVSECLNPFYCFQAFSCALWFADEYYMYASCIVFISAFSLLTQVYEMRRNQRALKRTVCGSAIVSVCREVNGHTEYIDVDSSELVPGDILEIPRNGCVMHCDALLLSGNCIVNESTLTGESVPVTKTPLPYRQQSDEFLTIRSMARHALFGGTSVIQTRNYADERVLAMVIRTGFRTAKGELVRAILFPKPLKFKFTQDALKFVAALATLAVIGFGVSIYLMYRSGADIKTIALRALDLITVAVPPALPMAMTVGAVFAQRRLRAQNIYCINPSLINVCGVINVTCFDKTGTLTEDGLDLWGVIPTSDGHFLDPCVEPSELARGPLLESMATCHSLTLIGGVLSGDPLDLKMFQSTKWEFIEQTEDHCKFEMAVPAIVRPCGTILTINSNNEKLPYEVGILRQFPFTSSLQRMSVIARVLDGSHFSVYTKGAPETIESLCRHDTIPADFHSLLLEYTREGYRVLALAWRPLKISYTRVLKIQRERVEQDLLFLGLLVMENRLKPESAPIIQELRNANIRPIMVTGDNMLTALSVARDCEMIDELDRIVIVSAKPPPAPINHTDPANVIAPLAGGDVQRSGGEIANSHHVSFSGTGNSNGPSGSSSSWYACIETLMGDQQIQPLVEFHYAEDLHKPVTEVTTTNTSASRHWHGRNRTRCSSLFSTLIRDKSKDLHWFHRRKQQSTNTSYTTVSVFDKETGTAPQTNGRSPPSADSLFESTPDNFAPPTQHRINIRMIDRPDFHLAISGKTWAIIREHYPWLIPKLVVKGTVFARFSPDQKTQLIEALQSVGYFVAMCGDGANDCGALKAAHAGVSLSEAEASVASPFTSKQQNISCIPKLIREGRCALVTSFGTLKFITGYSLIQFISVITLFYIGSSLSDGQFLYIDLFLITSLSVTFGYTKPYPHLSIEPPRMRLLSSITLLSLGFQLITHLVVQILAFISVRLQPWYIPLFDLDEKYEVSNYESTALFTVASYQYLILVIVFSKGAPYRRTMFSNYLFIVNLVVCVGCTLFMTASYGGIRTMWLELVDLPSVRYILLLHLIVLANFLICYLMESLVEGVSFRRQLVHIRHALFPRHVQRKDYERIREEIDRLAGSWPPLIRSASVQALPKELFHDTDAVLPMPKPTSRSRKRNQSEMSTETDDEELIPETIVFQAPIVEPTGTLTKPPFSATPYAPSDRKTSISRTSITVQRRYSFDASELNLLKQRCQPVIDCSNEDHHTEITGPAAPSNFLQMPESMFRLQSRETIFRSVQSQVKRKRHQSSGPQSESFYSQVTRGTTEPEVQLTHC